MAESSLQLGTREKPVRVTCDTYDRCSERFIYVQVNEAQSEQIKEMEAQEFLKFRHVADTTSNVQYRECKLRLTSKNYNLIGCRVTLFVRPGTLRLRRGRAVVDLLAEDLVVHRRPLYWWCL